MLISEDCASVFFSVSTIKQFVTGEKRLFFSVLKVTIEKNSAFLALFE